MKVLIAGAGNVGRHLGHILVESGHQVTLIEKDASRLARAEEESGAAVLAGDACEPTLLERAGIRSMDVVVAATGDDEDNLVVASLAKFEFGVRQVAARVKNAMNTWLYEPDLGVDVVVSAPHIIAQLIEERVTVGDVVQLLKLGGDQDAALVETVLPDSSPIIGRAIRDVSWPPDCVPAAVLRGAGALAARADTILEPGDRLLCVAAIAQMTKLHELLGARP